MNDKVQSIKTKHDNIIKVIETSTAEIRRGTNWNDSNFKVGSKHSKEEIA